MIGYVWLLVSLGCFISLYMNAKEDGTIQHWYHVILLIGISVASPLLLGLAIGKYLYKS